MPGGNRDPIIHFLAQRADLFRFTRHAFLPRPGRERVFSGLMGLLDPSQKSDLSDGLDFAPRLGEASRIARKFTRKLGTRREG